jgi:hypothetical protein
MALNFDFSYGTITLYLKSLNTKLFYYGDDMKQYDSYNGFYQAYENEQKRHISYEDVANLMSRLKNEGYKVTEYRDGRINVRSPEDIMRSKANRRAQQAVGASRFTKLGAAFPKEVVSKFAEACRRLGCTQSSILLPVVEDTIKRAGLVKADPN